MIQSIRTDHALIYVGVIQHYATLHERVTILTPKVSDVDTMSEDGLLCKRCSKPLVGRQMSFCSYDCKRGKEGQKKPNLKMIKCGGCKAMFLQKRPAQKVCSKSCSAIVSNAPRKKADKNAEEFKGGSSVNERLKRKYSQELIQDGLLSYDDLLVLVENGVIDVPIENINGSSVDVTLDRYIRTEDMSSGRYGVTKLYDGESIPTVERDLLSTEFDGIYRVMANEFLLASTAETLNLPSWITAEFRLKSTIGRNGMDHALAVYCDPWFCGKVTLELKNNTQFRKLDIQVGMKIGQISFTAHQPVPKNKGYAVRGQYMNQARVQPSKGVK